jgi:hypothetical protein
MCRDRPPNLGGVGQLPDAAVAKKLGRSVSSVRQKRLKLGVGKVGDGRR